MYVCMYVCVYVCMYVRMCVCVCVCVCVCMYVCMYVCTYVSQTRRAEVKCSAIYDSSSLVNRRNKSGGGNENGMGNRI